MDGFAETDLGKFEEALSQTDKPLFFGHETKSVDEKGRIAIPKKYREVIYERSGDEKVILTPGKRNEGIHLVLYDSESFKEAYVGDRLRKPEKRILNPSNTIITPFDRQGRIRLDAAVREMAGLEKDVVITSSPDMMRLEMWHPELFEKCYTLAEPSDHNAHRVRFGYRDGEAYIFL